MCANFACRQLSNFFGFILSILRDWCIDDHDDGDDDDEEEDEDEDVKV